jgi:hypothetical protein
MKDEEKEKENQRTWRLCRVVTMLRLGWGGEEGGRTVRQEEACHSSHPSIHNTASWGAAVRIMVGK